MLKVLNINIVPIGKWEQDGIGVIILQVHREDAVCREWSLQRSSTASAQMGTGRPRNEDTILVLPSIHVYMYIYTFMAPWSVGWLVGHCVDRHI